jgi:hypothetical protein
LATGKTSSDGKTGFFGSYGFVRGIRSLEPILSLVGTMLGE